MLPSQDVLVRLVSSAGRNGGEKMPRLTERINDLHLITYGAHLCPPSTVRIKALQKCTYGLLMPSIHRPGAFGVVRGRNGGEKRPRLTGRINDLHLITYGAHLCPSSTVRIYALGGPCAYKRSISALMEAFYAHGEPCAFFTLGYGLEIWNVSKV